MVFVGPVGVRKNIYTAKTSTQAKTAVARILLLCYTGKVKRGFTLPISLKGVSVYALVRRTGETNHRP